VLGDHTDTAAFGKAIQDLEFTATAVFATERQSALRELNGETIAIAVDMKHSR
jgi:hypothetical protein